MQVHHEESEVQKSAHSRHLDLAACHPTVNAQDEERSHNEGVLLCQQRGLLASALHRERDSAMSWPL